MRKVWTIALLLHGLIHLVGFLKGFEMMELRQLAQPISKPMGVLWLAATLLFLATAASVVVSPRNWWMLAIVALIVSQCAIIGSWGDAKFGTLPNLVVLLAAIYGYLTQGPHSFAAQFAHDANLGLAQNSSPATITEAELVALPDPVQRYLRLSGVVGRPRMRSYHVHFRGRIRSAADARWMPFRAEQWSFVDRPTRLFLMRATMFGVPVQAFHRFSDDAATMEVKVLGAISLVNASGPVMDRSETVTMFNDMCILAPGTLLEPSVRWQVIDAHHARGHFTNGAHTISATLSFDDAGWLSDFVSDDRSRSSPDGRSFVQQRFSTPVRDYRDYQGIRLASHGEARWHPPGGEFAYGEFDLEDIEFNVHH